MGWPKLTPEQYLGLREQEDYKVMERLRRRVDSIVTDKETAEALKPYYRFEYLHVPKSDTLLQPISNLAGSVAGVRYDITNFAAFKFEFRNQRRAPGQTRINSGFIQTSFAF